MSEYSNKNWNEFDWERKIRSDERNIHGYFREIDNFLDLPDEENMIMSRIVAQTDPVNARADTERLLFSDVFSDDEENIFADGHWRKRDGADVMLELENLAVFFNQIFAQDVSRTNIPLAMHIICLFGRLLANYAGLMEISDGDLPKLKISICKRLHHDLNRLGGSLQQLQEKERRSAVKVRSILDHLQNIREKIIKNIEKLRVQK